MRILLGLLFSTSVFGIEFAPQREEDLPDPALDIIYDGKDMVEVLVESWEDVVKLNGNTIRFTFLQGYNYKKKQGFNRTLNPDGSIYYEEYSADYNLMVSREEMMIAFEVFKKHPQVIKVLNQEGVPINLYGGFSFEDQQQNMPCYKGNRCVHIMASTSENSLVIHSIVKLNDLSVPYPMYDMEQFKRGKK